MKDLAFRFFTSVVILAVLAFLLQLTESDKKVEEPSSQESTSTPASPDETLMKGLKIE